MTRHVTLPLCLTIVAVSATLVQAAVVSEDVPVPGGIRAAAAALGFDTTLERARFVAEITRIANDTPETWAATESWLQATGNNGAAGPAADRDVVPVPLTSALWSDAVFRTRVPPGRLLTAILSDRRASLLCYGLTALDDETLSVFAAHPSLIRKLYEHDAAAFALFSRGLRVRNGRIVVPGAPGAPARDLATPLWEAAIGESVSRPDRFIEAMFERDGGRVAYLYDAIAALDPPHAAFALGLWIGDDALRRERFSRLARAADAAIRDWRMAVVPFSRPVYDIASLLDRVQVDAIGRPRPPASCAFWRAAFDGRLSPDPQGELNGNELIDAAWLADAVNGLLRDRIDRFDQLSFAQRVFAGAKPEQMKSALQAVASFPRFQMLMLTLERIGVTDPEMYATAVRAAERLSNFTGRRGFVVMGELQGALALVTRMYRAGSMDAAHRDAALHALFALPIASDGYDGAMAGWLVREFPEADAGLEDAIVARLAGPAVDARNAVRVEWEGQRYRLDLAAAERRRLVRIREKQGKPTIDVGVALASVTSRAASNIDPAAVTADLQKLVPELPSDDGDAGRSLRYDDHGRTPDSIVQRAMGELSKARGRSDRARAIQPLTELADALMAEALLSFAYAIDLGDPDSPVLLATNPVHRHDFGMDQRDDALRVRTAWSVPVQDVAPNVPWHLTGAALGLDLGLAPFVLRRLDSEIISAAPRLSSPEHASFAMTVALMNPYALDERERDAIAAAIARGRRRAEAFVSDPSSLDTAATEIRLDGFRRRALEWTIAHEPERALSMFSLTELMQLGGIVRSAALDEWGAAAFAATGCVCMAMPAAGGWSRVIGRPQLGLVATTVADLNLHVAITLRDLHLPAAITRHVLAAAMQDFVDRVAPGTFDDWLTLVRFGQSVSRERIEDYVAAVAADGPLVPDR